MRRLLTLRYDGTRYHGWQVQPNGRTVQQAMQDAIEAVTGVRAGVTGCSRTDAGVHADMFCCAFDSACPLPDAKLLAALNFHLPRDIAVYACRAVPDTFHPRYDATGKRYVYRIWNDAARNPFWDGRALYLRRPLELSSLRTAAEAFTGTHDYAAFCAAGSSVEDTVRTVRRCTLERQDALVTVTVEADGFLYHMVRILVGTLLDMAGGVLPATAMPAILQSRDRRCAGSTAPACGLYLDHVFYPDSRFDPVLP